MKMMKLLFSVLTMIILIFKFGEPLPKMMSIYGDVDFIVGDEDFSAQDTVGYMYDDVDGDFALNPSYCSRNRTGATCFQAHSDCTVSAYCNQTDDEFGVKYEPDFPATSTGSNILFGEKDINSPFTQTFAVGRKAFKFAKISKDISYEFSKIQCNNKNETHYKYLFNVDSNRTSRIMFNGSHVRLYEHTMKCVAQLYDSQNRLIAGRLFVLIINRLPDLTLSFPSATLSIDDSQFLVHNTSETDTTETDVIRRLQPSFKSNFVFRATSCTANITIEVGEKKSSVISLRYGQKHFTMPAIYADDSVSCGVQENDDELFEYWCDCSQSTEQID